MVRGTRKSGTGAAFILLSGLWVLSAGVGVSVADGGDFPRRAGQLCQPHL